MYHQFMVNLTFGEWLADRLDERDLQQQELAALVGAEPSTVSNWVKGKTIPREPMCDRIAEELGLDPDEVRKRAGRRPQPKGRLRDIREQQIGRTAAITRFMSEEGASEEDLLSAIEKISTVINERLDRIEEGMQEIREQQDKLREWQSHDEVRN